VDFRDLCEEITKVGMVPSGAVKFVLDALIDTLNLNLRKGISVQLGDFGCFRPGMNCESQDTEKEADKRYDTQSENHFHSGLQIQRDAK